ncbi:MULTISPECIES: flagellin domain-containing protein [unclassified Pseudomonas]|uniref:flagellin domain-containing protein n=1 Tax=unclassified Pseudomonas TaxID=196821 RepID=UPI000C8297E5|nr:MULTISPECIES: flagellin domain-containing protein [unclassified Pseudomonas]MDX9673504.1 flagellin domain-containing protein [Pseudomonas sp. P8_250]PMQ12553.1 Flagellin [Pseudomonas sp. AD21]WPN37962.1 flagellin domain-containing protein [Pseudomonas sp. P8_139]WPN40235.1 flagellin domain-containing protein [Pseudomonas sp. P8_229]
MALTVNTNTTSLNVQKNLNNASSALSTSMQRLSSGLKINSAKDDAAGLQISNRMSSQIRGNTQAIQNANDGISVAQTAEGALQATTDILQRMRELAVKARNGTNGTADQTATNSEFAQMSDEITRISASTNLNGKNLLDGSAGTVTLQVGANTGSANHIDLVLSSKFDAASLSVGSGTLALTGTSGTAAGSAAANADNAITAIDAAIAAIGAQRASLGASQNRLTSTISNLQNITENTTAAQGRVQDTDFAAETANLTKQQTLQQASTSVLAQANQLPSAVLKLLQ